MSAGVLAFTRVEIRSRRSAHAQDDRTYCIAGGTLVAIERDEIALRRRHDLTSREGHLSALSSMTPPACPADELIVVCCDMAHIVLIRHCNSAIKNALRNAHDDGM
ncbi:hypothetical protein [Paraburkholderia sacchari]|uniref:Uncharacterized protein n=2 Tax=Paraburkholderia sacchari TaxID=159450 RepID=A0A8T6ZNJ5_9BURK|nr:hypothetical protein [Paraburkholderia sacchari]NLP65903.1 hypothetical protein [Paraburkholderia sacchari]